MTARRTPTTLFLTGALLLAQQATSAEGPALPDNPLQGRLLFESKLCVECHATAGRPGRAFAPRLEEGRFRGTFFDLGAALWNHVPGMSVGFEDAGLAWPELSADETTQLVAFLYYIDYLGRPGQADAGEALYGSKGCSSCHGRKGPGPDLSRLTRFASPIYIAEAIWNHGPAMLESMRSRGMPPPRFADGDLADLSAFLRQLGQAGPQERVLLAPGNPNRGRELFESKGCVACHGRAAGKGRTAPDLRASDLHRSAEGIAATMWNHADAMSATMRQAGLGWPSFSTAELADLVAYLYYLPFADPPGDAERGEAIFEDRSCASCHGETARDRTDAPDLAARHSADTPAELVAAMWNHAPLMREAILGEGLPWPELTGRDLRDLRAFLRRASEARQRGSGK